MERGIDSFETDLGEFIIQLAEEPPSHIAAPAIHKTKAQVAELFSRHFRVDRMEDTREMTMFARKTLRERFLRADMGITGANFAVAETGSIVLFENEGNIRFSTTLPRIHVAVMGIEKVVPTLEDLAVFATLLARSGTGQKLTSYVSLISSARRAGEIDGPKEFHVVILDNGRSRILEDEELRETLYCIKCSACLSFCPVYLKIGGHAYGWIYSGPIGAILTPHLIHKKQAYLLPYASTLCGACAEVCPVKIDIPSLLVALRRRYAEDPQWQRPRSYGERGLFALYARVIERKGLFDLVYWAGRKMVGPLASSHSLSRLIPPLHRWVRFHAFEPPPKEPFSVHWEKVLKDDVHAGNEPSKE
jgi:L-lactate dehydrogenase complex protein LldF